ncbi:MAG: sulfatase, partial [Armatimonadota bacterium]
MAEQPAAQRPNIIFFMVDQLSAKWLEAASAGVCPTPNLDRLRARGVTFDMAFTSNPLCQPARSTIATGLTTRGHGVLQNGYQLDPSIPTFMQILQSAGWRTGAFGKLHFRPHYAGLYPDYRPHGFGVTHITEDARAGEWLDWVGKQHPEHYEAALATIWPTAIPELKRYGPEGVDLSSRITRIRRQFDWRTPEFPGNTGGHYTLPFPEPVSQTAWITERALGFIRDTDPKQPLYAHISYVQPHSPFCPPAEYMGRVDAARIPAPAAAEWVDDPLHPRFFDKRGRTKDLPAQWPPRHYYFADICHLDWKLGEVLDTLEDTGQDENTVVV